MNQLKTNKIGFSNELPNELQNENDLQITENRLHNTICGTDLSMQSWRELEVQQSELNEMNPKINESDPELQKKLIKRQKYNACMISYRERKKK